MNNNFNFKELAQQAVSEKAISPIIAGKVAISTDDVIEQYPEGITINEFDYVESWEHYVCTIKEAPDKFLSCGSALTAIFDKYVQAYDGVVADASMDFKKFGGLKVKLNKTRSKNSGKTFTNVTIL